MSTAAARVSAKMSSAASTARSVRAIVTVPPYAPFLEEVAAHPRVDGLRLNTVMPIRERREQVLRRLSDLGKTLWVDLKGRQLRVVGAAVPPFTKVRLSHRIEVDTPVEAWFSDGRERAVVVGVEGDRILLEDGPRRLVGPGESVNIVDPSLRIAGDLTAGDRAWLEAMRERGLRHVMLSYVECPADAAGVRQRLPDAEIVLKIESARGVDFAPRAGERLMAARGDLYVEVVRPHRIVGALRRVIDADPSAMVASRLFSSLARQPVPEAADVCDAAFLMALGYRTFMLGDEVCLRRESVLAALDLLSSVADEMSL